MNIELLISLLLFNLVGDDMIPLVIDEPEWIDPYYGHQN